MSNTDLKDNHNFKVFTFGQTILVKNSIHDDWQEQIFMVYEAWAMYPYICVSNMPVGWKYAKSI
jgi:hypothetical protein